MELSRYFIQVLTGLIIAFAGQPDDGDLSVKIAPNLVAWGAVFIILLLSLEAVAFVANYNFGSSGLQALQQLRTTKKKLNLR